ncbi:hypothetical protein N9224_00125 [Akkermansiaceae bacterium]|nr:hypothetical protein [Akkermansiaceae bacterium]MDB4500570.1 hypothetical protein [Akkermansiaceae bacterium]MDB4507986.1 hypothetical protein [Akkermansiaceae bacterium]MDB4541664.1 hypothetical protein [Akkermansiaceae bacterium]
MKNSLLLLLGMGSLSSLALAQEPTPEPTPRPVEPTALGLPGTLPEATPAIPSTPAPLPGLALRKNGPPNPNVIATTDIGIVRPELPAAEAAELYRKHTGKRVIMTSTASQLQIYFVQPGQMTNAEVAELLEISLLNEGIAIVPDQLRPNIVRMVASGSVEGVQGAPLSYIDDPLDLPQTDQLVTYKMQLENLKPDEALRVFNQVMGARAGNGRSITAVENASSLIIAENSAIIRQLIKLKDGIDLPVKVTEEWVTVVYADVDEIAENLNEIYNDRGSSSGTSTTRTRRTVSAAPLQASVASGAGASGEDIPPRIIPDSRTNRLLITGKPGDIAVIKSLIEGFDQPSAAGNDFVHRLRYVRVNEFLQIAYDAIEATMVNSAGGGGAGALGGNNRTNTQNRTTNNRTASTNNAAGRNNTGGSSTSLQQEDVPTAPEAQIVGKTLLVADNNANAIIVNGPPHHIELVKNLIAKLDSPGQQVVISAVIGSYDLGDSMNFGMDLAKTITNASGDRGLIRFNPGGASGDAGSSGNGVITSGGLSSLAELLTASGNSGQAGLSLYGGFGDDFGVFINALEANTNFKSLNRPVVTTRNNRVARISSGRRIAIPASTSSFSGQQNTNVEYRDVTLELEVQPLINSDTEVTLNIALVRDRLTGDVQSVGSGISVPDIATEELTTNVVATSGSAIILGGLITEDFNKSKTGIPILSRIPGIGSLLSNNTSSENRSELVIILRPQIISNISDYREFEDSFERDSSFTTEIKDSLPAIRKTMLPAKGSLGDQIQEAAPKKKSWWNFSGGSPTSIHKGSKSLKFGGGR